MQKADAALLLLPLELKINLHVEIPSLYQEVERHLYGQRGEPKAQRLYKKPANLILHDLAAPANALVCQIFTHTKLPAWSLLEPCIFDVRTEFSGVAFLLLICLRSI